METGQLGLFGGTDYTLRRPAEKKQVTDPRLNYWAVVELEVERVFAEGPGPVVWGLGLSRGLAIENAFVEANLHDRVKYSDIEVIYDEIILRKMTVVRCSKRFYNFVAEWGGDIDIVVVPGVGAFLPEEPKGSFV